MQGEILLQLVIGTPQERGGHLIHELAPGLGDTRDLGHRMLFGDADVDELAVRLSALLRTESAIARRTGGKHHHRMADVLDLLQCVDQRVDIVAVRHIPVIESEGEEQVVLGCAVGGTQFGEPLVDAAAVRSDGHLVVVEDDDEIGVHLAHVVEPFERLALTHRTVADEGDDVLRAPAQVTPLAMPTAIEMDLSPYRSNQPRRPVDYTDCEAVRFSHGIVTFSPENTTAYTTCGLSQHRVRSWG